MAERMRTNTRTGWAILVAAPLLSVLPAACGSDSGKGDEIASVGGDKKGSGQKVTPAEKAEKYKKCLSERGVSPRSGKVGEDVPDQTASPDEVEAALAACKEFAPTAQDMREGLKPDPKKSSHLVSLR